jgi:CDP-glucose 4,6-dehydratase
MFAGYYRGRRVWLSGHTGFKGAWLALWLKELGAEVHGFSLPAPTDPNLHSMIGRHSLTTDQEGDVRDFTAVSDSLARARPEIVFHLAAQPLVRLSYQQPLETLLTNTLGTAHVLEAVRQRGLSSRVILVTTDKCYENRNWEHAYREGDALGGHDVYSASKAAAELVASAWRRSFFHTDARLGPVATVRAGNVIGGGDYALDRIVPDAVRALAAGQPVPVRNPWATRPWQHVLDCLSGYLWLGARLSEAEKRSPLADAFNFGPGPEANRSVQTLVEELLRHWPGRWENLAPKDAPHEASRLNLAIDRAHALLGWSPTWSFSQAAEATAIWYQRYHTQANADMLSFTREQLQHFTTIGKQRGVAWATG